jgi:hypothetical protein
VGRVNFEAERLLSLKFNPLHYNNQKSLTLSRNLDPDSNFSGDSLNCDFYTENSLNNMLSNKTTNMNCLSFMHLNMRSLRRNRNQLQQLLASINNMFSVIGISETWLQDSTHHVDINGYNFEHICRTDKAGGGVGLYITSVLEYKIRDDLCFDNALTSLSNLCLLKLLTLKGCTISE